MKKRLFILLLAFSLFLGSIPMALAAPGDATVFDRQQVEETVGNQAYIQDVALMGNTLYFLFQTQLYKYALGDEKPVLVTTFLPDEEEGPLWFEDFKAAKAKLGDKAELFFQNLLVDGDTLYGYNTLSGMAYPIDTATGQVSLDKPLEVLKPAEEGETKEEDQDKYINTTMEGIINGKLFFTEEVYGQMGIESSSAYGIDLNTKEKKVYEIEHVKRLLPYKNNSLLVMVFDEMNAYNEQTQTMQKAQLMVYDMDQGTLTPYGELEPYDSGGIAYSSKEDAVFYAMRGKIYKMEQGQPPEHVGYTDESNSYSGQKAWITDEGLYILWGGGGSPAYVVNLDPQYMAQSSLLIYGGGYNDQVKKTFKQKYPDVPITYNSWEEESYQSGQMIAQAIQSGETNVDIFYISPQYMSFSNLMKKEYALDLSQNEEITTAIGRMYPFIQEAVTYDGKIYGVPEEVYTFANLFYSAKAFEAVGLTQEDVPKTYVAFLELAKKWSQEMGEENLDYAFFSGTTQMSKSDLVRMTIDAYINYYQKQKEIIDFDTPLFRKMMTLIEEMDLPMQVDYEQNGAIMIEDNYEKALFDRGGAGILNELSSSSFQSLIIPLDEGMEPALPVYTTVAFVNPLSNNKELAVAYLEAMATTYRGSVEVAMFADKNEPIKSEYYEETVKSFETALEEQKKQLETTEEADKARLEEYIKHLEELLENKDDFYWEVSQEGIDRYLKYLPTYYIPEDEIIYSGDEKTNVSALLQNYFEGALTLEQFITEANRRVQMMALELQ